MQYSFLGSSRQLFAPFSLSQYIELHVLAAQMATSSELPRCCDKIGRASVEAIFQHWERSRTWGSPTSRGVGGIVSNGHRTTPSNDDRAARTPCTWYTATCREMDVPGDISLECRWQSGPVARGTMLTR